MSILRINKNVLEVVQYNNIVNIAWNPSTQVYTITDSNGVSTNLPAATYTITIIFN